MLAMKSDHRWVKAVGISIQAWTSDTFKFVGYKCSGLIGIDEDTKHKVHLFQDCICVKNSKGEMPRKLDLIKEDWGFEISLLEDHRTRV